MKNSPRRLNERKNLTNKSTDGSEQNISSMIYSSSKAPRAGAKLLNTYMIQLNEKQREVKILKATLNDFNKTESKKVRDHYSNWGRQQNSSQASRRKKVSGYSLLHSSSKNIQEEYDSYNKKQNLPCSSMIYGNIMDSRVSKNKRSITVKKKRPTSLCEAS
eukprot:TRINITY_DN7947_c0_g1_i17.p1 TRINITY_DN7947_c0_g1~~TRINITY_DN7947_c0_g1_i17.p1  ORF type:complete len:161 (+),score=22.35 TRINITY_DN7947_c0_g1_i17:803-1285(+)